MKRILVLVVILAFTLCWIPFQVMASDTTILYSGVCGTSLYWYIDSNYQLVIYGSGPMYDYSKNTYVPWSSYASKITSVVVQDGITSISNYAFYGCKNVADTITLPSSVVSIGNYAFFGCTSFTTFTIPANVASLGYFLFPETLKTLFVLPVEPPSFSSRLFSGSFSSDLQIFVPFA